MSSYLTHIQLSIDFSNLPYYKDLFKALGWHITKETKDTICLSANRECNIWLIEGERTERKSRDTLNCISIKLDTQDDFDKILAYIQKKDIDLYSDFAAEPPKGVEFQKDEVTTSLVIKTPDGILLQIFYEHPTSH